MLKNDFRTSPNFRDILGLPVYLPVLIRIFSTAFIYLENGGVHLKLQRQKFLLKTMGYGVYWFIY